MVGCVRGNGVPSADNQTKHTKQSREAPNRQHESLHQLCTFYTAPMRATPHETGRGAAPAGFGDAATRAHTAPELYYIILYYIIL